MSFKKDEEVSFRHDKTAVIQEARMFNQSNISPRRCRILLTKILYLLYTGERFSQQEATDLFFGATKLFQNKDAGLRQIVPCHQGTGAICAGRHYGYGFDYEGHAAQH